MDLTCIECGNEKPKLFCDECATRARSLMLPVHETQYWKERLAMARAYGQLHYSIMLESSEAWTFTEEKVLQKLGEIDRNARVLDAGCGYGRFAPYFSDYVGVDFSPDLLAVAGQLYPEKTFVEANLKSLPFREGEFDVAFVAGVKLMVIVHSGQAEWDMMESELKRVARLVLAVDY